MSYGAEIWGPALISAGASYLSGMGNAKKESKMDKKKRKLVDQLLQSLQGNGPFSDLYNVDEASFQKSFVEPLQSKFRNQVAPQIQQQYIASGQQRGTGLDDTLTRAGVDMDAMLNQYYYQMQADAQNRKQGGINSILGMGSGAPNETTGAQNIMSGLGGYFSGENFQGQFQDWLKPKTTVGEQPRKGYEAEKWNQPAYNGPGSVNYGGSV